MNSRTRFSHVSAATPGIPGIPTSGSKSPPDRDGVRILVREDADVAIARKWVRQLATDGGLSEARTHSLATAVSEIARNLVIHAGAGQLSMSVARGGDRRGLVVVARDTGPGIPDLQKAMQDGYSTAGRLGLGLPGAQRLVDEFEIESWVNQGTTVTLRMWAR